jgi:hypothetical protein
MLKESVDAMLGFDVDMFSLYSVRQVAQGSSTLLSFFSAADTEMIKSKVTAYENNPKSRSGGSELLKCLQHIQTAKESLQKNLDTIKDILQPRVATRTTLAEATARVEYASIIRVAESFVALPEKMLRSFAETVIGDMQIEYTVEELPLLIATKQISGITLDPGKVL